MTHNEHTPDRQAVTRLFELSRSGEIDNTEFSQLTHMVYERMFETYAGSPEAEAGESIS